MLTNEQIDTIHRLHFVAKWTIRKIAKHLHIGRRSVAKYLSKPVQTPLHRTRTSKLDSFKPAIEEWLQQDASVRAAVIFQSLRDRGFTGGYTIVKDHLQAIRAETKTRRAFVRMEPAAGERFEIDWGHFGVLVYEGDARKLYAFCLIECHSRKMYLEFTHSQTFETLVRCHIHAFEAMSGVARELWFDNMATVVSEHDGNLVRFHPRFLAFARDYGFIPRACHVRAAWEKGKVERAIGYVRQNFWPLRRFVDLSDINSQAHQWLQQVANQRRHRETGQTPAERFHPEYLRRLATTDRSLTRQVRELLTLIREYGPDAVAAALAKAHAAGAFGADYIANILRQQQSRRDVQPPLCLKDPALNQLATDPLSLSEYDASSYVLERNPMNSLHQKLTRLALTTITHNLEQLLTDTPKSNIRLTAE